jgi:hypothetical protein
MPFSPEITLKESGWLDGVVYFAIQDAADVLEGK